MFFLVHKLKISVDSEIQFRLNSRLIIRQTDVLTFT